MKVRARTRLLTVGVTTLASVALGAWVLWEYGVFERSDEERLMEQLDRRAAAPGSTGGAGFLPTAEDRLTLAEMLAGKVPPGFRFDSLVYTRYLPHHDVWSDNPEYPGGRWRLRTNNLGLRNDEDVGPQRPALRVLVTGDSHTDGICANDESFVSLLGAALRAARPGETVEALNAGVAGYAFYNYLGVVERYAEELAPDVFVLTAYGGNDFSGTLHFQRYFGRRPSWANRPYNARELDKQGGAIPQEFKQLIYFLNNPDDVELAARAVQALTDEMQRLCLELGIVLVCVYLPPPTRGQPALYRERRAKVERVFQLPPEFEDPSDVIADAWLARLDQQGILHLDLRPVFQAGDERLYWQHDSHINLAGQRAVARALQPLIEAALSD